jgi:hypothetical protein
VRGEGKRDIRKPTGLLTASPSSIIHLVSSVSGGRVYAVAVQVSVIICHILLYLMTKLISRP